MWVSKCSHCGKAGCLFFEEAKNSAKDRVLNGVDLARAHYRAGFRIARIELLAILDEYPADPAEAVRKIRMLAESFGGDGPLAVLDVDSE